MTIMSFSSSSSTSTRRRRARTSARTVPSSSASIAHLLPVCSTLLPAIQPRLTLLALLLLCPPSAHAQYFYTNTRHELSPGAVAGIVVAAVLVVLFFLGMYLYNRRRQRRAALVLQRVNSEPPMEENQAAPRMVHFPERPQTAHSVGKGGILRSSV
ncbi:hypothetical protein K523DRAFT_273286 [Schizophyllum commune Tattone D]|nr:hypothetical protein K523DRAFT_273286 [Schizophyllum commune Tattone D]